jgi:GTPase Era involved in 16S rRNA processing
MSKKVLRMKYHPAMKKVHFHWFKDGNENPIHGDSVLKGYMDNGGRFVLQDHGNKFLADIAKTFSGEKNAQIEVMTTKNDYEDFEQMVEFYNKDKPPVKINITLLAELPDMEKTFRAVKKHGENSLNILKVNKREFFRLKTNTYSSVNESVDIFTKDVQREIESIEEKIKAMADTNVNLCFVGVYSSGKSALINAIVGFDIMPVGVSPETARMFRIQSPKPDERVQIIFSIRCDRVKLVWNDKKNVFEFEAEFVGNSVSCKAIKDTIESNTGEKQHKQIQEILRTLNTKDNISADIYVYFPIPLDNKMVQFTIYDTPGTDSNYGEHEIVLQNVLEKQTHSILIFVFEPKSTRGNGNLALLNYLKEAEKNNSKTSIDIGRSLFVSNFADSYNFDELKEMYKEELTCEVVDPNFLIKLSDKKLFFTSAKYAKVANATKTGDNTSNDDYIIEDEYNKILRPQTGRYFLLNRCGTSELATKNQHEKSNKALEDAIKKGDKIEIFHIGSGVFSLENEIKEYGEKFAAAVRAFAIIDSVDKALSKMEKKADSLKTQNQKSINDIDEEIKGLSSVIELGISKAYNKRSISSNNSLTDEILNELDLNKTYLKKNVIDKAKKDNEKFLKGWFFGLFGKVFFDDKNKELISKCITDLLDDFTENFRDKRKKLLEHQRDDFMKDVKEIICKNKGISEEAKKYVCEINPPAVLEKIDHKIFYGIYEDNRYKGKFLLLFDKDYVNPDKVNQEIEEILSGNVKDLAEIFKTDYRNSLTNILNLVAEEFKQNLKDYSVIIKAKNEDKKAMEQLRDIIVSVADGLSKCQQELEEIIWSEKTSEQ